MSTKRWPTIQEVVDRARQGIIDETTVMVRPDAAGREAIRADLEQFQAQRHAVAERPERPERPARRRKPA